MKKSIALLGLLFVLTSSSWAGNVFIEPVAPVTPEVLGNGRASTATAHGYNSLFTNPAAFSRKGGDVSFSIQLDPYLPLSKLNKILGNISAFSNFNLQTGGTAVELLDDIIRNSGLGFQAGVGIGYVGNNIGLGLIVDSKYYARGKTAAGGVGTLDVTEMLVVGYSLPVDLKFTTLHLGLDVRPMVRTYTDSMAFTDLLSAASSGFGNLTAYNGFGLGWDLGAMADFGPFTAGLSLRDIGGTGFSFRQYTLTEIIKAFTFTNNTGTKPADEYRVPMTINVGGAYHPDLGQYKSLFDPTVQLDFQIPLMDENTQPSFWTMVHVGAEAKFLSFLTLRTGLNQGYFTFGVGVKVPFFEVNMAIYGEELSRAVGVQKRSGLKLETAFRY